MKVLKFGAAWCTPCKMLQHIIDGIDSDVPIESVDIDEESERAMQYAVRGVPTLVMLDDTGTEIKRNVGVLTRDKLLEWLK